MAKHIQAYFKSEDQAEGARTSLLTFEMEQVEIGSLDRSIGRSQNVLVPLVPMNSAATNTGGAYGTAGIPGAVTGQSVMPPAMIQDRDEQIRNGERVDDGHERLQSEPVVDVTDVDDKEFNELKYVLSAKVSDADYEDIVHKLRTHGAFVEHLD